MHDTEVGAAEATPYTDAPMTHPKHAAADHEVLALIREREKQKALEQGALSPSGEVVTAVNQEMSEAVDYFGPIRVVGTAFVLGFGIARRIKSAA